MARLIRVSIMGDMPGGEVWSVNPVFSVGGDFGAPVSAAQANTIATAIDAITVSTGVTSVMAQNTRITGNRVEARAIDGTLESQAEHVRGAPVNGTVASAPKPFQTSIVSSLRTATPGPSGRGRLYWPATGINLGLASYRFDPTAQNTFLLGVKTYLSGIQAAIDVTFDGVALVVWSRSQLALRTVNSVQVGDVADTQRRRRDTLTENVLATPYP